MRDIEGQPITVNPGDILVLSRQPAGHVDAPQAPVATFSEEDIAAYGVDSITDLLAAIAPETGSGRGRGSGGPVILVNGRRIASFREIHDYPPEAILRVDVLPEEVALRYGFSPDSRVVNVILKDHFRARTGEIEGSMPDAGGTVTGNAHASLVRIDHDRRLNVALKAVHTTALSEAARGVMQAAGSVPTVAGDPDPADFRSLVARSSSYNGNATWTLPVGGGASGGTLALNFSATHATSSSLSGLDTVTLVATGGRAGPVCMAPLCAVRTLAGPLSVATRTDTVQGGAALNTTVAGWQLAATVDNTYTYTATESSRRRDLSGLVVADIIGPLPPLPSAGVARVSSSNDAMTALVTGIGHPLALPAGPLTVTAKAGFAYTVQGGTGGLPVPTLARGDASAGVNVAVPLTSHKGFGAALGDITLNLSGGVHRLAQSAAGWRAEWSAGATWAPTDRLNLQGSFIASAAPPGLGQLGNPLVTAYNVPLYDFVAGRTVLVTALTGGNPALRTESEHDIKLGANWTLPFLENSNLIVEWFDNRSNNVTAGFPLLTPGIEAAFASRITARNPDGSIAGIDERPVNLAGQHEARLRWGVNLFGNIGAPLAPTRRAGMFAGGGGYGHGGGGGSFGRGFGGGPGGHGPRYPGRWNLALYHTVQFIDRVRVTDHGPVLDLLHGDALASSGGVAVHSLEAEGGGFYKGLGLRLNATWSAPTHVNAATSALRFGALAKINLRGFFDFGQRPGLIARVPFLRGARASLMVNNVFDARQRVTDAAGQVPIAYQPQLIDPLGRVIGVELRKLF